MSFQIHGLPLSSFNPLFSLSDKQLAERNILRVQVDSDPGFPCRVSLADAKVGETVLLLNYMHQPQNTPYQASHAIFVRENAQPYQPKPNEVPQVLSSRLLSVRAFNAVHHMIGADVIDGETLGAQIKKMFLDENIAYIHIHNAKPGCYAARAIRA